MLKCKVIILCGGRGTRLKEETEFKPKPLVEVGGRPILWHIMKIYAHYGFNDFILCLGYKGEMIREYFLIYEIKNNDFTLQLGNGKVKVFNKSQEENWKITFVDTGEKAQTGSRVKQVEKYVDGDRFMLTYGDGVADIKIDKIIQYHQKQGKIGTITGVHPPSRFGELLLKDSRILEFNEKPQVKEGFINGGFFVFQKEFFQYLENNDNCYLEDKPLEKLVSDQQLSAYQHNGFWQCMDTQRELDILNQLWADNKAPWKVWT